MPEQTDQTEPTEPIDQAHAHLEAAGTRMRALLKEMVTTTVDGRSDRFKEIARLIAQEPFNRRTWSELSFLAISAPFAAIALGFVAVTFFGGLVLAITFFGLAFVALSVRMARGFGGFQRQLARGLLNEQIEDPEPFTYRPGFLGWLQSALRDRTGWRAMAYLAVKVPLATVSILVGFAAWWDAFFSITYPVWGGTNNPVAVFGLPEVFFGTGFFSAGQGGFFHSLGVFCAGVVFFFAAPWAVRIMVYLDRRLMRVLLAPDALTERVRVLERARAQSVDSSAATLRRIERDLHDGTQAQLVALAMRLGMAKEKLAALGEDVETETETGAETGAEVRAGRGIDGCNDDDINFDVDEAQAEAPDAPSGRVGQRRRTDLDQIRQLVDDAHRGAKEAIVELRDLARGIHPPALDVGLEGALSTLAARSTIPTELTVTLHDRPTPAIEAIAYFCVAELLANVAQHAQASRASIMCTDYGEWLRVVVRDDGKGGAELSRLGSSSSGLVGLTDRVHAVDGRLDIASPPRGPTVVTVDLPLHA
jgi:signal transduction histidine kinase